MMDDSGFVAHGNFGYGFPVASFEEGLRGTPCDCCRWRVNRPAHTILAGKSFTQRQAVSATLSS